MTKVTLSNVGSLIDATTAANTINANTATIQTAFDNTISRDGTAPNTMLAAIDMNSNQIYNLPAPSTTTSPARLIDVTSNPTIVVPGTGTSGHTVPFLDTDNTWSGAQSFNDGKFLIKGASSGSTVIKAASTASGTINIPAATDTLVGRNTTDTLTNKTLTAPTINSPVITSPAITSPAITSTADTLATFVGSNADANGYIQVGGTGGNVIMGMINTTAILQNLTGTNIQLQIAGGGGANVTAASFLASSPVSGVGYSNGAGATGTQATSKSTTVTLSKNSTCGQITMNNAALAAATIASFAVTNTSVAATDVIIVNHISGGTLGAYTVNGRAAGGSFAVDVRNNTAGSLSEAIVLQFAVIKAVNA